MFILRSTWVVLLFALTGWYLSRGNTVSNLAQLHCCACLTKGLRFSGCHPTDTIYAQIVVNSCNSVLVRKSRESNVCRCDEVFHL